MDQHSSLFDRNIIDDEKKFYDVDARHAFEARSAASSPSMEAGKKKFYNFLGFVVIS